MLTTAECKFWEKRPKFLNTERFQCRSPFFVSLLTNGNYFFTTIFAVESFIKLAAMSPRYFFAVSIIHNNVTVSRFCAHHASSKMST